MIKLFTIIVLAYFISDSILAGENEKYTEKVLSNLEKVILDNKFERGTIYFHNDSIVTDILLFKKRERMNAHLFCIAKTDNNSIKVLTAKDIIGYKISNELYIRYNSSDDFFFIKKIKTGKVDLYEKRALPSDNKLLFYLKIPCCENLFVINPSEKNISETIVADENSPNRTFYASKMIPQKFKEFISIYLGDCVNTKNLVDSEFYTINDIPSIIEAYNSCF